jgi:hypothetical protein
MRLLSFLLVIPACVTTNSAPTDPTSPGSGGKADGAGAPTITFGSHGVPNTFLTPILSDKLVPGQPAVILYDPNRTNCLDQNGGTPTVRGFMSVDGGSAQPFPLADDPSQVTPDGLAIQRAQIVVPQGHQLALWFESDLAGDSSCTFWDSNLGNNFMFAIGVVPVPEPVIHFPADGGAPTLTGTLVAGHPAIVRYDLGRRHCIDVFGNPSVQGFMSVDGGTHTDLAMFAPDSTAVEAELALPPGHDLALWFSNDVAAGEENVACTYSDSNQGANFHFSY